MVPIKTFDGQSSYTFNHNKVSAQVTVQGGHLTGTFKCGDKNISPFFMSPWWNEAYSPEQSELFNVLRGDFFCFPFGLNDTPHEGRTYPLHGQTSNDNWQFKESKEEDGNKQLQLSMELENDEGEVVKTVELRKNEPLIYTKHTITGFTGKMPIGHHAMLRLPEEEGSAIMNMTKPVTGFTNVIPMEDPATGGYILLKTDQEISDPTKVQRVDGEYCDLTRFPTPIGYEDVAIFVNDAERDFVFSSLAVPNEGYLFFQLKNPKVLAETLIWMSNKGRHYAPWNGRIRLVALEEITGFFYHGHAKSIAENKLSKEGYKTFMKFDAKKTYDIKTIMGVVPIGKDFIGVEDIVRKDDVTITIVVKSGKSIDVGCDIDFLR